MDVEITCPLGSKCEEVRDNQIYRCAWYVKIAGKDPQSEKEVEEWGCGIYWNVFMQMQVHQSEIMTTASIDKVANEIAKSRDEEIRTREKLINAVAPPMVSFNDIKRIK